MRRITNTLAMSFVAMGCMPLVGCKTPSREQGGQADPVAGGDAKQVWTFDDAAAGTVPPRWSIRQTRPTAAMATWKVVADASAPSRPNVLALTETENYDGTYNLAIADGTRFGDFDLTVKVKGVSGEEDQGGGPIWRCRDENNYYICRFNPLESNYRVYFVQDGKRKQLASADVDTEAGRWYTVRVTMAGDRIACYLEGEKLLDSQDATFPDAGCVGLWTKADAVTSFDDLAVQPVVGGDAAGR